MIVQCRFIALFVSEGIIPGSIQVCQRTSLSLGEKIFEKFILQNKVTNGTSKSTGVILFGKVLLIFWIFKIQSSYLLKYKLTEIKAKNDVKYNAKIFKCN